ncbi:MAG: alpha-L-fucosidase [Proteobacteria bacterium]|nr:alpha-L-fucosidase [Pseudomonadota bacterium]
MAYLAREIRARRLAWCSMAMGVLGLACTPSDKSETPAAASPAADPHAKDPHAATSAAVPKDVFEESKADRDARMAWWRQARFGMFIHWGVYAVPAGRHKGKHIEGNGEWIQKHGNIPRAEYEKYAAGFNPVKYDPDAWVRLAKEAGMKYLVITSKHHDGFALWDTKVSDWDVVDRTPYKKDLLAPLAQACKKHGLRFTVYHSILDWHHPAMHDPKGGYSDNFIHAGRKQEYVDYMKGQLKELMSGLDPAVLWFDGEWIAWWTEEDGRDVYQLLRGLKPDIIINNRVGKGRKGMEGLSKQGHVGDFGTPEQQIPPTGLPGVDWESCMTMNDTWGFKHDDHNWKSTETLVRNLIDIASKGGNYLLNVGPTAEGLIPAASVERLKGMGRWMKVNSDAIYGTTASPVKPPAWGRFTSKGDKLFAHVFDWPKDGRLELPALGRKPAAAHLLSDANKTPLMISSEGDKVTVGLPPDPPDPIATVVVLTPGSS